MTNYDDFNALQITNGVRYTLAETADRIARLADMLDELDPADLQRYLRAAQSNVAYAVNALAVADDSRQRAKRTADSIALSNRIAEAGGPAA